MLIRLVCVAAGVAASLPGNGMAQSLYQHRIAAPVGLAYDSNLGLSETSPGGVYRLHVSPSYTLMRKAGSDELEFKLGALIEQSSDTTISRNRQDGNARLSWRTASATTSWGWHAAYEQSAARAALLEETGQLSDDGTRITRTLGAQLAHELDERHLLSAMTSVKWQAHDFGHTPDHRLGSAQVELSRAAAPGQDWFVSAGVSQYAPRTMASAGVAPATAINSVQRGLLLGYRSQVQGSPWDWQIRAGVARFTGAFSDTMPQGEVKLGYQSPRWRHSVSLSRLPVANNLLGSFAPNTQARFRTEYRWSEYTTVALDASHNRTQASETEATRQLGLQVSTELSPLWRMTAQWRGIQAARFVAGVPVQATNHSASLVFTYLHPDF
jgi:hypothetical protein